MVYHIHEIPSRASSYLAYCLLEFRHKDVLVGHMEGYRIYAIFLFHLELGQYE